MDIKAIYKKGMEAIKRGQDVSKILKPEEIKAFVGEQIKHKIIMAIMPWLGWILLACIIVSLLLAVFMFIFEFFSGLLGAIAQGWGYLWSGTNSLVSETDVYNVYTQLIAEGVDFEQIGAIGEIYLDKENKDIDDFKWTTFQEMSDADIESQIINKKNVTNGTDILDENGQPVKETIEEARKRLWVTKLIDVNDADQKINGSLYHYLRRYLEAQSATFSAENNLTFSGESGNVKVYGERDIWEWLTDNSQALIVKDGRFYVEVKYKGGEGEEYSASDGMKEVTNFVEAYAMPWQYPFAFHQHTLSPDVGYKVADLAFKYHYLKLKIVKVHTATVVTTHVADDGYGGTYTWTSTDQIYSSEIYPEEVATWFDTTIFNYPASHAYYNSYYDTEVTSGENYTRTTYLYDREIDTYGASRETYYNNATSDDGNPTGVEAMEDILLPLPTVDPTNSTITTPGVEYYRSNILEKKDSLNIKSSAEAIIKSLHELYETKDSTAIEKESVTYKPEGEEAVLEAVRTTDYFQSEYPPVKNLIQFFLTTNIIDASTIIGALNVNKFITTLVWPIDEAVTSTISYDSSTKTSTIYAASGSTVLAPANGTISIENGAVKIETAEYIIFLQNVSPSLTTGTVAAGAEIGTVSGSSGIKYSRMDKTTSEMVDVSKEVAFIKRVASSDYMWPVPGFTRISSPFGMRDNPTDANAGQEMHNGIDVAGSDGVSILGAQIVAFANGTVTFAGYSGNAGNLVTIVHENGLSTKNMHLYVINVREGQEVKKGEVIGLVGSTGRSTGPHLHFQLESNSSPIDPLSGSYLSIYTN